jgi:hypothetical protein
MCTSHGAGHARAGYAAERRHFPTMLKYFLKKKDRITPSNRDGVMPGVVDAPR